MDRARANETLIVVGMRTPIGSLGGVLASVPAPTLGATCIKAALEKAAIAPGEVDEVIMGNVVAAGIGQNPARQAAIKAGLPTSVGATTVNKVCGSGLKSVMLADQAIRLAESHVVVAGGMESMSASPYLVPNARQGYRMGHGLLVDSMIQDGLWDVYGQQHMGTLGDRCAAKYKFSKHEQDDYAIRSYTRARKAIAEGIFDAEVVPVEVPGRKGSVLVTEDEEPSRFNEDKLRGLKPAFAADGTVTAGNASSVNDGAAALVLVSDARCASLRLKPIARIVGSATFSREPEWFTTAPIGALHKLLDKINWSVDQIDLFEINEAFSNVPMAAAQDLEIPADKLNIYGGAVALGHPIGCTGARILVTLLTGLERTGGKRGVACLCIGGGEAVALAVERI
ncbi:MAG TPA: acetyl-CoA C-acyltransferase [Pirellulales bacterium]|nr:acetyl-CoA C-acyltransferase [Pirellulales bacterium]